MSILYIFSVQQNVFAVSYSVQVQYLSLIYCNCTYYIHSLHYLKATLWRTELYSDWETRPHNRVLSERLERRSPCWLLKLRHMGNQRVQMKGVLPWLVRWACRAGTRDFCPALAASRRPSTKYFLPFPAHYFSSFVFIAQQTRQAVVLGRLGLPIVGVSGSVNPLPPPPDIVLTYCNHLRM